MWYIRLSRPSSRLLSFYFHLPACPSATPSDVMSVISLLFLEGCPHVRSQLISNYDRLLLSSSITLEFRFGRMQSDDAYSYNLRIFAAYLQRDAGVACHSIYLHDRSSGVCEAGQSTPVAERKHGASSTSCSLTTHTAKRSSISRRTCTPFLPIILSRLAPKSGLLVRLSISKCTHSARRCRVRLRSYRFHAAITDTSVEVSRTSMR